MRPEWILAACAVIGQAVVGAITVAKVVAAITRFTVTNNWHHRAMAERIGKLEQRVDRHEKELVVGSKRYHDVAQAVMRIDPEWEPYRPSQTD